MSARVRQHTASGKWLRDLEVACIANVGEKCSKLSLDLVDDN